MTREEFDRELEQTRRELDSLTEMISGTAWMTVGAVALSLLPFVMALVGVLYR